MAPPQLCRERDRDDRGQLGAAEVVDVVVLGDDEALPLALGQRIDRAVELEENRPALERELGRVRVRDVDRPRRLAGRSVPEPATMGPGGHVGHDVELLARILERALEREVVVRRDDELMRRAPLAKQRGEPGEKAVQRTGLDGGLEVAVELVVERP